MKKLRGHGELEVFLEKKTTHSSQGSKIQILSRVLWVIGICETTAVKLFRNDVLAKGRMPCQFTCLKNTPLAELSGHIYSITVPIWDPSFLKSPVKEVKRNRAYLTGVKPLSFTSFFAFPE